MKLWQKEYGLDERVEKFTVGIDPVLDLELIKFDCLASIAHTRMLEATRILSRREALNLERELKNIIALSQSNKFRIRARDEDGHTAIENHLVRRLGATGKKIHAARSRNDQVLVALRLYSKDRLRHTEATLSKLIRQLAKLRKKFAAVKIPGYTHSRKAMPYTVGKYFGAFGDAFRDDLSLLRTALRINDQNPLGSAAGYGTSLPIDRRLTTRLLKFRKTQWNELYAQNSRGKFEGIILFALSQIMLDLQKLAQDLILYSMDEFGFFALPKEFCSGSSIMPHKKNPDVLEIARAKFSIVHAHYLRVIDILKGLPSGYHRDLQLTKEPLIRGFGETIETLEVMSLVLAGLEVNRKKCNQACTEEIYSADRALKLVREGVPFRDAYRKIARRSSHR
jgi:argininosuccinate lyase